MSTEPNTRGKKKQQDNQSGSGQVDRLEVKRVLSGRNRLPRMDPVVAWTETDQGQRSESLGKK